MIIYLDQNKWIDLARSIIKPEDNPKFVDVATLIQAKSENGEWTLPISMVHFFETCSRSDVASRTRLAKVMSKLSQNKSIRSFIDLTELEFINAFSKIHKGRLFARVNAISKNLFDALGPLVPTLEISNSVPKEDQLKMQKIFKEKVLGNDELFGVLMEKYHERNLDPTIDQDAVEMKISWEALQSEFSTLPIQYRYKVFLIRSFMDHFEMFYKKVMAVLHISREDIIPQEVLNSQDKILELLESVPSLDVRVKLMYEYLKNPMVNVHEHDDNDVVFLSTAIPYADVVITEKSWKHFANKANLGTKYNTIIENDLNFLKILNS